MTMRIYGTARALRSGPSETASTGTRSASSSARTYMRAATGRSEILRTRETSSLQREFEFKIGRRGGFEADALAAGTIARHDRDLVEAGEYVEFRDDDARESVETCGIARRDGVEPAAASRTSGHGAELSAAFAQRIARSVEELRGKRSGADAGAVRLRDADDAFDLRRSDAQTRARAARDRMRTRDVRVGAVADVEQRALRALDEHALSALQRVVQVRHAVDDVLEQSRRERERLRDHVLFRRHAFALRELRRARHQVLTDLIGQRRASAQIAERDARSRDLVGVSGPDAAARRADRRVAARLLVRAIERRMIWKHDVRAIRNADAFRIDPDTLEHVELFRDAGEAHDRTAADEQLRTVLQYAAGHDAQREFAIADDERVARIIAAGPGIGDHGHRRGDRVADFRSDGKRGAP